MDLELGVGILGFGIWWVEVGGVRDVREMAELEVWVR
jgi:hypothetical protein